MIKFITNSPLPTYSKDFIEPKGAAHDNNGSTFFVESIEKLYKRSIDFLDLGCAGGALVNDMYKARHNAYGIEGSEYQKKEKKNSWGIIPERLYNADITEPFGFFDYDDSGQSQRILFDVISAWDVLEHLEEDRLPGLVSNIKTNLKQDGIFVCGIAEFEDEGYHVTLHNEEWWVKFFEDRGMKFVTRQFDEVARRSSFELKFKLA